jgi:hypothetical protein
MPIVPPALVGAIWPAAEPGNEPNLYGRATLTPTGAFEARSLQSFTLTYTAGPYGLDDTGAIRVCFRFTNDGGPLQLTDPQAINYVTARASNGTPLALSYQPDGHLRPFMQALTVRVQRGCLREGDTIAIVFGDRSGGSPGLRLPTFCEAGFEFKVLADVIATAHFLPLPDETAIAIVPGPPAVWKAVLPTIRHVGEPFALGLKAEDRWGNPSDQVAATLHLHPSLPVAGLPDTVAFPRGQRALRLDNLTVDHPGELRITLADDQGATLAETNPLLVRTAGPRAYWGDLHGQSGETVGVNTARDYFTFARDLAFLDAMSHQGNDFQIKDAFWRELNRLTAEFQQDGRFVAIPGYEWSGNTAVGGDRNVFYRHEGRPIRRSSRALLVERDGIELDCPTARHLFAALADEDAIVYAHVGGRYADIAYAHDPRIETSVEIHSDWGTFEWLLLDSFQLGYRCGVVCNSDGHKGRPGASYPGAASFGAYGGLTCFLTDELSRDAIFDALRRRRHYGTTGDRIHLDLRATLPGGALRYPRDPRHFAVTPAATTELLMGDIAQTADDHATLTVTASARAPIERIDVLNGATLVATLRGYTAADLGSRIRVIWSGAEYRGRGRQTRWTGHATFRGARVRQFQRINAWNPERRFDLLNGDTIVWDSITTGNFAGFDARLDADPDATLTIQTNLASATLPLAAIGLDDHTLAVGGLDRRLRIFRLPDHNPHRTLSGTVPIPLSPTGDNPLWVRVTTEDGHQAWSSPIFVYRE